MRNGGEGEAGAAAGRRRASCSRSTESLREPQQPHDLGRDRFVRLVETVAASGEAAATLKPPAGGRSTILTFDDATADHAAVAEHLAARGVPAIFFVPSARVGCADHLARDQVAALATLGHGVGSHGATHRLLDRLSRTELIDELRSSKDELEQIVGHAVETSRPPAACSRRTSPRSSRRAAIARAGRCSGVSTSTSDSGGRFRSSRLPS